MPNSINLLRWPRKLFLRFRSLFHRNQVEQELDTELQFHLDHQIEENIAAGMSPEEAHFAALRTIGVPEQLKEQCRDTRRLNFLNDFVQDLRYALRQLRKSPGFTTVAVLSLALGIGANTAIFTLINAVMLKQLPVKDPAQLTWFIRHDLRNPELSSFPYPFYRELRDHNTVFSGVICQTGMLPSLNVNGRVEQVTGELVSGNFFTMLGINPYLGRVFTQEDDRIPGAHPVMVLSYDFWQRRFGADPSIIGKTVRVNTTSMMVIGVSPPRFDSLEVGKSPDIRVPMAMDAKMYARSSSELETRNSWWLQIFGRLKPGIMPAQAKAQSESMLLAYMGKNDAGKTRSDYERRRFESTKLELQPAAKGMQGMAKQYGRSLLVLMAIVGSVLLIACVNIANLLLARTTARQQEIAIRLAIGAGRARLIRQLLTESILLASLGGTAGIFIAYAANHLLIALLKTGSNSVSLNLTPDTRVLGFTLLISCITGLLFGFAPAIQSTRFRITSDLKGETVGRVRLPFRKLLISGQIALSLILLIAAGLFLRSLHNLHTMNPGFNRENVLQLSLDPRLSGYKAGQVKPFYREVIRRVGTLPGVRSTSLAYIGVITGSGWGTGLQVEGFTPREDDIGPDRNIVGPGYFATMGIPLITGRDFTERDGEKAPHVAIVNEKFARFYFGNQNPLGRHIGNDDPKAPLDYTIVGVVTDGKYAHLREKETPRFWYTPYEQYEHVGRLKLYARTIGYPMKMAEAIRREIQNIDRNVPIFDVKALEVQMEEDLVTERLVATLSSFFSGLASILAAIGLYGVMAYTVTRRTREIGIRMALGAQRSQVLRLVLNETVLLVVLGIVIGIPVALALGRFIASMLFNLTPGDPIAFVAAAAIMLVAALFASYLPARRAARVDPMTALRHE